MRQDKIKKELFIVVQDQKFQVLVLDEVADSGNDFWTVHVCSTYFDVMTFAG